MPAAQEMEPLLSVTAFSYKKPLTHEILHTVTEGCTSVVGDRAGISNLRWEFREGFLWP